MRPLEGALGSLISDEHAGVYDFREIGPEVVWTYTTSELT